MLSMCFIIEGVSEAFDPAVTNIMTILSGSFLFHCVRNYKGENFSMNWRSVSHQVINGTINREPTECVDGGVIGKPDTSLKGHCGMEGEVCFLEGLEVVY